MTDPRVERLAELVVGYSLELREGQIVRIDGAPVATPLIVELHRAALRRGAHPYTHVEIEGLAELLIEEASEEQLTFNSPLEWREIDLIDANITIWSESNTRSFTRLDPNRHQRHIATRRELRNRLWDRISRDEARWSGTLYPTNAHAQDAELSLREYEDFVYRACHVDEEDPVAHWRSYGEQLVERARWLDTVRELRLVGEDTDLRVVVEGRSWQPAVGKLNMPDGEVYTSPVETETEGTIRFSFPAIFEGREVRDVRLRFEHGRVERAEAAAGGDYLQAMLDMDEGAGVLGEVAFGLNYEIDRFTRNILFDEKLGGTMHLALGSGFETLGSRNRSGLHWDMICDLRKEGEVYADGELVWRAGNFLVAPEPAKTA
ncbi:MAG: aminopeptidase [Gaiellaceae bacterium]